MELVELFVTEFDCNFETFLQTLFSTAFLKTN